MVRETIVLTRRQVADEIDIAQTIPAIEACFAEFEKGATCCRPSTSFLAARHAACIFGYTRATHLLTMKLGQGGSQPPASLTTGTLQLYDPTPGLLMIVESVLATMYRTGAAAAVAAKHLSRPDARVLAVVGAGQLGRQVVRAVATVRPFERIYVTDALPEQAVRLVNDLTPLLPAPIEPTDPETAGALT
jgi:ornithine cyclodeaminase/alanine dehydrogenase-like protein (mu-crystallin family)